MVLIKPATPTATPLNKEPTVPTTPTNAPTIIPPIDSIIPPIDSKTEASGLKEVINCETAWEV